jgi:predicted RNase H-like nuclease (RuvC/YqgF family)
MSEEKPKRQYNYGYEHKAKIASRKAVKAKEKEIAKLKKNLENKTKRLRDKKEALQIVQNAETNKETKQGSVMEDTQYDNLPNPVKELLEEEKERIVFKPNSGPQTDF